MFIGGVPVAGANWAAAGQVQIIGADFIERIQTEDLRIEISYEDSDNFQKNLVTATVECFENLNLLRTDAHCYFTI